ncbi:L,D-transpeptidase family protein [Methylobacterium planeticum]|uniref:L,D-transpeptidase family protein n=1 Tax=Methylobacterium planeticum TaxID=2615211 RepID=A0A6N6MPG0_9HYPH|nr:L,D-transpeptidase family protein [Methylobacterium planeticum]KAB1070384.1 L,D-transpeptidase family protein [Methylobacterium planeticum]
MGVSRSATVALAALLAGSVAHASLARAQSGAGPAPGAAASLQRAAVEPAAPLAPETETPEPADPKAAAPDTEAAKPGAARSGEPAPAPAAEAPQPAPQGGSAPASGPAASAPGLDPAPVAEAPAPPPVPSDPQAAAVATRLAAATPLLPRLTTREREAIQAFYALGAFRPVWVVDGRFTPAARSAAARLAKAGEDGLDPNAYPVPVLGVLSRPDTEAEIAEADLKLSAAVALYARDARGGRISLANLSRLITPALDLPAPDAVLGAIATGGAGAGDLLQRYNPQEAGYRALKQRLAALRDRTPAATPVVRLPGGPVLKLGMRDARVPLIRARFGLETRAGGTLDAGPGEPEDYDAAVAAAITDFQRSRGLPANGMLTVQTVVALATPPARGPVSGDEPTLLVNMERWRWLPSDLGRDYVMVNIPEFRLRVVRDGSLRDEARVIVGKTESPTPIFSGAMEYAVVNPSWNVPPSILKNEFLPGLARDPNYAARRGYQVVRHGNAISVRQPPGERNALGFIKFMFPNNHAVYLHDTPNRALFSAGHRAMSHGCVRVDDPFRFADAVLPDAWSSERLKKLIGKGERSIRLPEKLPVHLAYFTAYLDDGGGYRTLPDLYGYDARMRTALGLPGGAPAMVRGPDEPKRKVAEAPRAPKPVVQRAPRRATARASAEGAPVEFGEPGLWTPRPAPVSRGWW